jgi:FixJ family two-component response regulator
MDQAQELTMLYDPSKNECTRFALMDSLEREQPASMRMARSYPSTLNRFPPSSLSSPTVFMVDRDCARQEAIELMAMRAGFESAVFGSAAEFLSVPATRAPSCVVIGASLGNQEALDLQAQMSALRPETAVIFISDCDQIDVAVKAMKAGATEYLMQPFDAGALLIAIQEAIEISRRRCVQASRLNMMQQRYALLSGREQQVMSLVTTGQLNKQIGGKLGICEMTVKAHRGKVMTKMKASSLADLVNMAAVLGLQRTT